MNDTAKPQVQTLQTVERALNFLEFVAASPTPPTVKEVSEGLGLNITTSYHLFRTLSFRGYLERDESSLIRIGTAVAPLFAAFARDFDAPESLRELVTALSHEALETAYLSTLEDRRVLLRVLVEGPQQLKVSGLYVGLSGDIHHRASGKAILAAVPDTLRDERIEHSFTGVPPERSRPEIECLKAELDIIKERGWSLDDREADLGITSMGAVVRDANGQVFGAVGLVAPSTRFKQSQETYVAAVQSTAVAATAFLQDSGVGLSPESL